MWIAKGLACLIAVGPLFAYSSPYIPPHSIECRELWSRKGLPRASTFYRVHPQESYPDFYKRLERDRCWKKWLVVIYMAADNDLSPYAERDIWEAEAAGSTADVDVVVFLDRVQADGFHYLHIARNPDSKDYRPELRAFVKERHLEHLPPQEQEEIYLRELGKKLSHSPEVRWEKEGDSGQVETLTEFLSWAFQKYPSREVFFIGWSHGQGFDAPEKEDLPKGKRGGFAFDDTARSHMAVTEVANELKKVLDHARGGHALDIAGSDACLNQQVEFGYEWRGLTRFLFGSSTIVQKKGLNYRRLLEEIDKSARKNEKTLLLASRIPQIYGSSVTAGAGRTYSSYYDPFAIFAVWDVPLLEPLKISLNEVGAALTQWIRSPDDINERISRLLEIHEIIIKTLRYGGISNDLANFLLRLNTWSREKMEGALHDEEKTFWQIFRNKNVNPAISHLTSANLASFIGARYQQGLFRSSRAVGIWLPLNESESQEMLPKFKKSQFYTDPKSEDGLSDWAHFVELLYATEGIMNL